MLHNRTTQTYCVLSFTFKGSSSWCCTTSEYKYHVCLFYLDLSRLGYNVSNSETNRYVTNIHGIICQGILLDPIQSWAELAQDIEGSLLCLNGLLLFHPSHKWEIFDYWKIKIRKNHAQKQFFTWSNP